MVKELVIRRTPRITRNTPLTTEICHIHLFNFLKYARKELTAKDVRSKGSPKPAEYTARSSMPVITDSFVLAISNIEPSIGPMHGVHPAANTTPTKNVPR